MVTTYLNTHNDLARIYMTASDIEREEQQQMGHPPRIFTLSLVSRIDWLAMNQRIPANMHPARFQTPEQRLEHFNQTHGEIAQVNFTLFK
jgi:hypothetical protein